MVIKDLLILCRSVIMTEAAVQLLLSSFVSVCGLRCVGIKSSIPDICIDKCCVMCYNT